MSDTTATAPRRRCSTPPAAGTSSRSSPARSGRPAPATRPPAATAPTRGADTGTPAGSSAPPPPTPASTAPGPAPRTASASPADPPGCSSSTPTSPSPTAGDRDRPAAASDTSPSWRPGTGAAARRPTPWPPPPAARTATIAPPADLQLGNTAGQLGPLVDTRGAGGYVVAATHPHRPPLHASSTTAARRCCRTGWPSCSPRTARRRHPTGQRQTARQRILATGPLPSRYVTPPWPARRPGSAAP